MCKPSADAKGTKSLNAHSYEVVIAHMEGRALEMATTWVNL